MVGFGFECGLGLGLLFGFGLGLGFQTLFQWQVIQVTEDDANLDPSSGGLVVYKKQAPLTQGFDSINSQKGLLKAKQMIEDGGMQNITIPFRGNRAVVFNSNLWHKTDSFRFQKAYKKRRINITMLFGSRKEDAKDSRKAST